MNTKQKAFLAVVIIALILVADQTIKIWVKQTFYAYEYRNLIGSWFRLYYVENQGMAFGATFGSGMYAKLFLSIFRLIAVGFGFYYLVRILRDSQKKIGYIVAVCLVLAGALGNLIDSAFYDFWFEVNPDLSHNWIPSGDSFVLEDGVPKLRAKGFLLANVVDMFQFNVQYPEWVPYLAGKDVFSAIWNLADSSIFSGIVIILIGQRAFFPSKKSKPEDSENHQESDEAATLHETSPKD